MRHRTYNILTAVLISFLVFSCGDKKNHDAHDGHSHDNALKNEGGFDEKDEHAHDTDKTKGEGAHANGETEEIILTSKQFDALQMKVEPLVSKNLNGYVEANGTLEVPPQSEAAITSIIGANVVSIEVIEGEKINKGQVVAYLRHPDIIKMQTDYLNAYSNRTFLNKNFERQQKLYDAGVGSGANFQKSEAEYEASKALVKGLAAQLKLLNISPTSVQNGTITQNVALRSPIAGYVQKVKVKTGQYVEPKTELFDVVNTDHVHADLMVFEKDVFKLKKGQKVVFNIQSSQNEDLIAQIYSVGKTFEDNPKAVHVHAEIENKEKTLIPGMYIKGKIQIEDNATIALPESAVTNDGGKFYVFSAKQENNAWAFTPIEVYVGIKDDNWVEVKFTDAVKEDTKFAYNNAYYLIAEMKKGEAEHAH